MGGAIGDLLPLSIGLAVNPIPIIAVVLVLQSRAGRTGGAALLGGWLLGLTILAAVTLALTDAAEEAAGDEKSTIGAIIRVLLGLLLLFLAARKWGKRPQEREEVPLPKWAAAIKQASPGQAGWLGALIAILNPKHIALTIAGMVAIAEAAVGTGATIGLLVTFVVLGSLGVGIPVGYALAGGERAQARLSDWQEWLIANSAAVLAVLFLVFGVLLLGKGIGALIG